MPKVNAVCNETSSNHAAISLQESQKHLIKQILAMNRDRATQTDDIIDSVKLTCLEIFNHKNALQVINEVVLDNLSNHCDLYQKILMPLSASLHCCY